MRLLSSIGLMKRRQRNGHGVTLNFIDRVLDESHIFCGLYWGSNGHACLIYGVSDQGFHVMDPARGRGLWLYPPNHFASVGRVVLGTSLMTGLARTLEGVAEALRPPVGA